MPAVIDLGFDFVAASVVNLPPKTGKRVASFDGSPCPKCKNPLTSFKSKKNGMVRVCRSCKKMFNKKNAKLAQEGARSDKVAAAPKLPSTDFEYVLKDEEGIEKFLETVHPNKRNFAMNLNKIRRGETLRETPWLHHLLGHIKENMKQSQNGIFAAIPSTTPDEQVYADLKSGKYQGTGLDNLLADPHFAQSYGTMHPRHLSHLMQGMEFVPGDKGGVGSVSKGDVKAVAPEKRGYITPDIFKRAVESYEPDTSKGSVDSQAKPGNRIKLAPAKKPTKVAAAIPRSTVHGYEVGAAFSIAPEQFAEPFVLLKIEDGRVHFSHPKLPKGATMDFEKFATLHKPNVVDFVASGVPSLAMGNDYGADFAGDEALDPNTLGHYPTSQETERQVPKRTTNQTGNENLYRTNPQFERNANAARDHFAKMRSLSKDVTADPQYRHPMAFSDSLENLMKKSGEGHSKAIQHGYALAYPEDVVGKPGYPINASDAIRRHMDEVHNNYYSSEHPGQPVPHVSESVTAPAELRKGPETSSLKDNLKRIAAYEDLNGPSFMSKVLHDLPQTHPEEIRGGDHPEGPTPYNERLEKLKSGSLDRSKLDDLMRSLYHTHGAVTTDQLLNHVVPHIGPDLSKLTPKLREQILTSEKAHNELGAQEAAARQAEKERIAQEVARNPSKSPVEPPAAVHAEVAKYGKYLTPNSTYVTPQGTYKPAGRANMTLGSGKQPVVTFKLVKPAAGQHAKGMMHIPVDKLREFIKTYHRSPSELAGSNFEKTVAQTMPSYARYSR